MIRVLIADNQPLTREGIKAVLSNLPDIEIIGQAINLTDVARLITNFKPHELIIDHGAGSTFEVADIKTLLSQFPGLKLLVLSNAAEKDEILSLTDAGIINYIFKGCTSDDLVKAVYATAKGEKFFCDDTLKLLHENEAENELAVLSTRESEIVQFIAAGMTNKEIADKLFLSIHTIKTHRKNIIKKLGFTFKNAADLVDYTSKSN